MSGESAATLAELTNANMLLDYMKPQEIDGGEVDMCKALDDLQKLKLLEGMEKGRAEGMAKGRAEGMEKGIEKEKLILIEKMRRSGMTESDIEKVLNA